MKKSLRHKVRHHQTGALDHLFSSDTDGKLRLAAVAFIAIGFSYLLWQAGMLPGLQ